MQQLSNTDYFILTDNEARALKEGLAEQMKEPAPIVPSSCGDMMKISNEDDRVFLKEALS